YWGVGNDLFAFLVTYHEHGDQKHPTATWLKELVEHPGGVLSYDDARNWAERTVIMLCSQTTDTSIELYWHDDRLHSRHTGTPPSSRSSSTRWPPRWEAGKARCRSRWSTAPPRPTSPAGSRSATPATRERSTRTSACSASRVCMSSTAASCRPTQE